MQSNANHKAMSTADDLLREVIKTNALSDPENGCAGCDGISTLNTLKAFLDDAKHEAGCLHLRIKHYLAGLAPGNATTKADVMDSTSENLNILSETERHINMPSNATVFEPNYWKPPFEHQKGITRR